MMMGTTVHKTARNRPSDGFTLVELLVVVAIIALIATIAVALLHAQVDKAKLAAVAADLRAFEFGFLSYASDNGTLPPDSHTDTPNHLPEGLGVEDYLNVKQWVSVTRLGGNYNWEGLDEYPYAGIALSGATAAPSLFAQLDERIDDGNLSTGKFRITPNSRYTWVIDD